MDLGKLVSVGVLTIVFGSSCAAQSAPIEEELTACTIPSYNGLVLNSFFLDLRDPLSYNTGVTTSTLTNDFFKIITASAISATEKLRSQGLFPDSTSAYSNYLETRERMLSDDRIVQAISDNSIKQYGARLRTIIDRMAPDDGVPEEILIKLDKVLFGFAEDVAADWRKCHQRYAEIFERYNEEDVQNEANALAAAFYDGLGNTPVVSLAELKKDLRARADAEAREKAAAAERLAIKEEVSSLRQCANNNLFYILGLRDEDHGDSFLKHTGSQTVETAVAEREEAFGVFAYLAAALPDGLGNSIRRDAADAATQDNREAEEDVIIEYGSFSMKATAEAGHGDLTSLLYWSRVSLCQSKLLTNRDYAAVKNALSGR